MLFSRLPRAIVFGALMGGFAGTAMAQDYPTKPVRLFTGGAGGASDLMTRMIAQRVLTPLGQTAIVENRPTIVTAETVAKAAPDGHTLMVQGGGVWISPLFQDAPWDPERDFAPITLVSRDVLVLTVNASLPVKSIKELVAYAKARPGQLNYATGAAGSTGRLAADLFRQMAGLNMVRIPFNTGAQQIQALLGNQVHILVNDAGQLMPLARAGKLTALAVTSAQPSDMAPGLPTIAASGVPGYEWIGMTGMFAPARTPQAIINKLNQETVRFLRTADAKAEFAKLGAEIADSTPEQFAALVRNDRSKTMKLIQDIGKE